MSFCVTQCPACESTFSISARLLESAEGKVRCGACLTIFEAPENIVAYGDELHDSEESVFVGGDGNYFDPSTFLSRQSLQEAALQSSQDQAAQDIAQQFAASATSEHDAARQRDEQEFLEAVADGAADTDADTAQTALSADDDGQEWNAWSDPEPAGEPQFIELEPADEPIDEAPSAVITDDQSGIASEQNADPASTARTEETADNGEADSSPAPRSTSPASYSPYSPFSQAPAMQDEHSPESFRLHASFSMQAPARSTAAQESTQNEIPNVEPVTDTVNDASEAASNDVSELTESASDWTLAGSDETAPDEDSAAAATEQASASQEESATPEATAEQLDQSVEAIRARALQAQLEDDEALEAIPSENLQALGKFSTPVEILAGKPSSLRRQLTWSLLALLGGLMLGAQYLWQEIDRFSQNTALRPLYESACQWFNCDLPVYTDIDAIRANNLAVRSHPTVDNALAVNIEFQNLSPFAQQFPILILSFNAANNSVIALREFAANEYLPEALRNRRLMPPQTPLQVDLSIIDPGADAVNYTLAFRRP